MKKALAGLTGVVLTLAATTAVLVFQRVTGGGQAAAEAAGPPGSGTIVIDWNKELVRIVSTPGFGFSRS